MKLKQYLPSRSDVKTYGCLSLYAYMSASFFVRRYVIVVPSGISMLPTVVGDQDIIIARKLHKGCDYSPFRMFRTPQLRTGSVVVAEREDSYICKRISRVGGDTVEDVNCQSLLGRKVPQDHFWLTGDNSPNSLDSRSFGPVASSHLFAKALCIIWPPWRWSRLA
eukprot:GHVH01000137.1.p1 GENE.GHVH01000137.1~~GHVH01000137.1.p1  ORF type:complete len:165 (+),score=8.33 GHVH01000137.1:25-519(+)